MPDKVSPEVRSRIMSRVRAKNTRPELALRRAMWLRGLRGWRCHVRNVTGTPDIAWVGRKIAVFVDSAWWHGHPSRWTPGRLPANWDQKIRANQERDAQVNESLTAQGWQIVRIWDFEIGSDLDECVDRVERALSNSVVGKGMHPN
jgi:DNA mismatch endonuclease (patch repair protein)